MTEKNALIANIQKGIIPSKQEQEKMEEYFIYNKVNIDKNKILIMKTADIGSLNVKGLNNKVKISCPSNTKEKVEILKKLERYNKMQDLVKQASFLDDNIIGKRLYERFKLLETPVHKKKIPKEEKEDSKKHKLNLHKDRKAEEDKIDIGLAGSVIIHEKSKMNGGKSKEKNAEIYKEIAKEKLLLKEKAKLEAKEMFKQKVKEKYEKMINKSENYYQKFKKLLDQNPPTISEQIDNTDWDIPANINESERLTINQWMYGNKCKKFGILDYSEYEKIKRFNDDVMERIRSEYKLIDIISRKVGVYDTFIQNEFSLNDTTVCPSAKTRSSKRSHSVVNSMENLKLPKIQENVEIIDMNMEEAL